MIYFRHILLNMLSRLNEQRTISSAYHILCGKKSSQTLQDIHLFELQSLYSLYPKMHKTKYDSYIEYFMQQRLLEINDETFYLNDDLAIHTSKNINNCFNGLEYYKFDQEFLMTIHLLAQTLSQFNYNERRFIPVIDDLNIHRTVKQIIRKYQSNQNWIIQQFHHELLKCLEELEDIQAEIFVMQLTGKKRIGLSKSQLAEQYQVYEEDIHFTTVSATHYIISTIKNNPESFILLSQLIPDKTYSMTESTTKTFELFQQGYTLEKVEAMRKLKHSTIQDHVVEIATQVQEFNIRQFVSFEVEQEIIQVIKKTDTKRLKQIKAILNPNISYFQIRLVLARLNQDKASATINE